MRPDPADRHVFIIPFLNRFMHWMAVGIGTTVMSLMMLSKGATLDTIGLVSGFYSAFVVAFEFPSGILSDVIGRKKIYLFSLALSIAGYSIVLFTHSLAWLFAGFALYGVARAFSSGSVEALFISKYMRENGKDDLHKLLSVMGSGEVGGLAVGALLGGVIPSLWQKRFPAGNKYDGNLAIQICVLALLFFLTLAGVREERSVRDGKISLLRHTGESLKTLAGDRNLILLFAGTMAWGFSFNAIELFWQPRLKAILGGDAATWIFGAVNSGYFLASLAGVGVINLILKKRKNSRHLLLFSGRIAIGAMIVFLSFQDSMVSFSSMYLLLFMVNGMMNIPESTILNTIIPDDKRSSLLSLSSLVMQLGGIIGSVMYSMLVKGMGISGVWILSGIVFAFSGLFYSGLRLAGRNAGAESAAVGIGAEGNDNKDA